MPDDDELYLKRQGYWMKAARERSGKSQQGAAEKLGFSKKSKSTISDYENGLTAPSVKTLRILADWYEVPLNLFIEPQLTPEERIDEIVRLAGQQERRGSDQGQERAPAADDAPGDAPGRLSA